MSVGQRSSSLLLIPLPLPSSSSPSSSLFPPPSPPLLFLPSLLSAAKYKTKSADFENDEKQNAKLFIKWRQDSAEYRGRCNMSQNSTPWTGQPRVRLCGLPNQERVRDIVDICYGQACKKLKSKDPKVVRQNLWCNPSQSLSHSAKAVFDRPGTFTKSSRWYSYRHDATLTGSGQLQLLGWHTGAAGVTDDFRESDTRSLSGLHRTDRETYGKRAEIKQNVYADLFLLSEFEQGDGFSVASASVMSLSMYLNPFAIWWKQS